MKLRLRENSIRLRLLQAEVRQLGETGVVTERITFGDAPAAALTYSLRIAERANAIGAEINDRAIEIFLPAAAARQWIDSTATGLYQTQNEGAANALKISVEKDFICVERPADEDNKDAFPHPKTKC